MVPVDRSRFVILEHDHPFLHWDLLMQHGEVLKAWRLLDRVTPKKWIPAQTLPDHRLLYLDYEGPVSNDRGSVHRVASGWFRQHSEPAAADAEECRASVFALFECRLATFAYCRGGGSSEPEWCFE